MKLIPLADWPRLRQRFRSPALAAVAQRLRQEAQAFVARPVVPPPGPAGYYHDYFCPEHGVQLIFDPFGPTTHRCPVDGKLHRSARYDAAWRWSANNLLSESALRLALLWHLDGDPQYLDEAAAILKAYAARYPDYLTAIRNGPNPGVATYTTLDESVWLLPLTWAYDLIRDHLKAAERDDIAAHLLAPAAEHLVRHRYPGIHNFTCWHNAAIGTVGVVLERPDLLDTAIHGELGFDAHLDKGVLSDGFWYEGSISYHFYTLAALLWLAKATRHIPGLNLWQRPALQAMFLAPVQAALPDGSLPAPNDCWYFTSLMGDCCHGVPPAPAFYEVGYGWYGHPLFARVLHQAYADHGPRDSLDALLFGRDDIPQARLGPQPSVNLSGAGYAILRSAADDAGHQQHLLLKYGPHGGGHGHPDKLAISLYAHGHRLSPDLGTPGYGLASVETWYRQTLSHNTVVVDGQSQPPATGHLIGFQGGGEMQVADAAVAWGEGPYAAVTLRRVLLARPDYFLDLFLVQCDRPRRIDWIHRSAGRAHSSAPLAAHVLTGDGAGYEHLLEAQCAAADDDVTVEWRDGNVGLWLFGAGAPGSELLLARVPGHPPTEMQTLALLRRHAAATAFLSVVHACDSASGVTAVDWLERDLVAAGAARLRVRLADGRNESWRISLSQSEADGADFAYGLPPLPELPTQHGEGDL